MNLLITAGRGLGRTVLRANGHATDITTITRQVLAEQSAQRNGHGAGNESDGGSDKPPGLYSHAEIGKIAPDFNRCGQAEKFRFFGCGGHLQIDGLFFEVDLAEGAPRRGLETGMTLDSFL